MHAYAVRVKLQTLGELFSRSRPTQLAEQTKQARAGGLRKRILGPHRNIHPGKFYTLTL